jgi:hypothetical protein
VISRAVRALEFRICPVLVSVISRATRGLDPGLFSG